MNEAFFQAGPRDPLLNRRLTAMLMGLITPNPVDTIKAVVPGLFVPGQDGIYAVPFTARKPSYCMWEYPGGLLILFSGMQDLSQTIGMIAAWNKPPNPPSVTGVCSAWEDAWRLIVAETAAGVFANKQHFHLVGHSFGGAVASFAAVYFGIDANRPTVQLITYGAPRIGTFAGAQAVGRQSPTRWRLTDDPVPFMPPGRQESESLAAVLTNPLMQGMSEQTQTNGGWLLSLTGDIEQNNDTARRVPRIWLSIGAYLGGSDSFFAPNHAIGVYNSAFAAAVAKNPIIPPNPPVFPVQPPPHQTPAEIRRTVHIGEAVIEADAQNPNGVTRNYAPPPVLDPTGPYYRAARDGQVWVVKLGNTIVAAATGKRSAKVLARRWNRSSRAALRMNVLG